MKSLAELASLASLGCPEAPASQCASASCYRLAENVGFLPVVKSELKLREIQRQIFLAHTVIAAHDSALEQRPERFNRIGMHDAAHVFTRAMANYLMRQSEILAAHAEQAIAAVFISRDQFNLLAIYCLPNEAIERHRVSVLDHLADDAALARDRADHGGLAFGSGEVQYLALLGVHVLRFAAVVRLVHFDDSHQLLKIWIVQRSAQPHAHIPRGFVRAVSEHSMDLQGADSLLGSQHQMQNLEPLQQRLFGFLENRSSLEREAVGRARLGSALHTLPVPRTRLAFVNVIVGATRASRTLRPATRVEIGPARFLIREQPVEISQRQLRYKSRSVHSGNISKAASVSQLRYTPQDDWGGGQSRKRSTIGAKGLEAPKSGWRSSVRQVTMHWRGRTF